MDSVIWIVLGVIVVVLLIALIALAIRRGDRRKLAEAGELRRDAQRREQELEREHAAAREREHRAAAAAQEARAKAAEAEKLRVDADRHRQELDEHQRDVARMEEIADELDPGHRADPAGTARDGDAPGGVDPVELPPRGRDHGDRTPGPDEPGPARG